MLSLTAKGTPQSGKAAGSNAGSAAAAAFASVSPTSVMKMPGVAGGGDPPVDDIDHIDRIAARRIGIVQAGNVEIDIGHAVLPEQAGTMVTSPEEACK